MNTKENRACNIYAFLNAAQGNWRNSIFIECEQCAYGCQKRCHGFLLVPNFSGLPMFMPVSVIYNMTGILIDKSECIASMSRKELERLYSKYLEWNVGNPHECTVLQILAHERFCHDCDYRCCYSKKNTNQR